MGNRGSRAEGMGNGGDTGSNPLTRGLMMLNGFNPHSFFGGSPTPPPRGAMPAPQVAPAPVAPAAPMGIGSKGGPGPMPMIPPPMPGMIGTKPNVPTYPMRPPALPPMQPAPPQVQGAMASPSMPAGERMLPFNAQRQY